MRIFDTRLQLTSTEYNNPFPHNALYHSPLPFLIFIFIPSITLYEMRGYSPSAFPTRPPNYLPSPRWIPIRSSFFLFALCLSTLCYTIQYQKVPEPLGAPPLFNIFVNSSMYFPNAHHNFNSTPSLTESSTST